MEITYPISFSELIGQQKVRHLLWKTITSQRIPHAFLFRGPHGVGKKTASYILGTCLNCQNRINGDSCGSCPSCRKHYSGNHPDFTVIKPDGLSIKIGQIRKLKELLRFPAFEGQYRVICIHSQETMLPAAANSILKILEEPPDNTIFILITDQGKETISTIQSRCQLINFGPLSLEETSGYLQKKHKLPLETSTTLAAISEGSIGRAEEIYEKKILGIRQEIIEKLISTSPDSPAKTVLISQLAEQCSKLKQEADLVFVLVAAWFRDLALIISGVPQSMIIHQDLVNTYKIGARRWKLVELFDKLNYFDIARKQLYHNCNRRAVYEVLLWSLFK
jgi:DNA polymerase III subunit delta'